MPWRSYFVCATGGGGAGPRFGPAPWVPLGPWFPEEPIYGRFSKDCTKCKVPGMVGKAPDGTYTKVMFKEHKETIDTTVFKDVKNVKDISRTPTRRPRRSPRRP